jgi:hypothetical protein
MCPFRRVVALCPVYSCEKRAWGSRNDSAHIRAPWLFEASTLLRLCVVYLAGTALLSQHPGSVPRAGPCLAWVPSCVTSTWTRACFGNRPGWVRSRPPARAPPPPVSSLPWR